MFDSMEIILKENNNGNNFQGGGSISPSVNFVKIDLTFV